MAQAKRYTLINNHIGRGSLFSQNNHALHELWKKYALDQMTDGEKKAFMAWGANPESEPIEVILEGGVHGDLEDMYDVLVKVKDLPAAKFNESQRDLCGACTAVTFVASSRIVAMNNFARFNGFTYANAFEKLKEMTAQELGFDGGVNPTEEEAFVASKIAFMNKLVP